MKHTKIILQRKITFSLFLLFLLNFWIFESFSKFYQHISQEIFLKSYSNLFNFEHLTLNEYKVVILSALGRRISCFKVVFVLYNFQWKIVLLGGAIFVKKKSIFMIIDTNIQTHRLLLHYWTVWICDHAVLILINPHAFFATNASAHLLPRISSGIAVKWRRYVKFID
jgi:hypothetical protein